MSQYASRQQLADQNLPAAALEGVPTTTQDQLLTNASGLIDSYLRARYRLPLPGVLGPPNTFPPELVGACLAIAAYDLLVFRGFNPDEYDANFKAKRDFYLGEGGTKGWLDKLASGAVSIDGALDASPLVSEGAPRVTSRRSRGWYADDGSSDDAV